MLFRSFCQLGLGLLIGLPFAQAQQNHHHICGVDEHDGQTIKQRMLSERAAISDQDLAIWKSRRSTIYIPVTIHLLGTSTGQGHASPAQAMGMICRLNEDYADQNIRFYLQQPIRYLNNDPLYNDAYNNTTMVTMRNNKVANTMNIFVGPNVSRPVAGYYSPSNDFVFMLTSYANSVSTTITHEAGHFYSLPHTFVGWENLRVEDLYGSSPVPNTNSNNRPVERFARTGAQANCDNAADGFCDTPADYYAYRVSCPFRGVAKSPDSVMIEPDSRNYMSYFGDECMSLFSNEQKDAMNRNLINRRWNLFTAPNITDLDTLPIALTAPGNGVAVPRQGTVRLDWTPLAGATGYVVKVERTLFGAFIDQTVEAVVTTDFYDLYVADLPTGFTYRWYVKPFNGYQTCAAESDAQTFVLVNTPTSLTPQAAAIPWSATLVGYPQGGQVQWLNEQTEPSFVEVRLLDALGRVLLQQKVWLEAGQSTQQLYLGELPKGLYLLHLQQEGQQQVLKFQY